MSSNEIRKILVPIDFSSCSRGALEHALALANRYFGAQVDVLHVWETPRYVETHPTAAGLDGQGDPAHVKAIAEMEELLSHAQAGSTPVGRLHEPGEPVPRILEVAARGGYDLIIMGTHGRTGMAHDYLGSVAEKVVRRAPCPVLTYRERRDQPQESAARQPEARHVPRS